MQERQGMGAAADDSRLFSHKPLPEQALSGKGDDLTQRLQSLPAADRSPQRPSPAEWDPERWDGMA